MLENKKLFLLDIDGTICKGNQLVEGSATFLKDIKANEMCIRDRIFGKYGNSNGKRNVPGTVSQ